MVRVAIIKESTRTYLVVKWLKLLLPMQGTWFQSGEKHNLKRYMHPNVHAALFTIAKAWKPPKRPWTEEWIEEMWCIYIQWNVTQPLRKNETMPFAATGMGLEIFILSEVSQIQKEKYHMVSLIYGI